MSLFLDMITFYLPFLGSPVVSIQLTVSNSTLLLNFCFSLIALTSIPATFVGAWVSATSSNHVTGVTAASARNSNSPYAAVIIVVC